MAETGAKNAPFDVIVDDGGHTNKQIRRTFEAFWPHVKRGGLYFIEDMHKGKNLR